MTAHDLIGRAEAIQAAVRLVYEDAEVPPPIPGSASSIVPLERLIAGQGLRHRELADLTRGSTASFLNDTLKLAVELLGPASEQLAGYLYGTLHRGEILVNCADPITRRRFTVAHELGHYVLHARPLLEAGAAVFSEAQPNGTPTPTAATRTSEATGELGEGGEVQITGGGAMALAPDTDRWEIEANQFAAELLMPEALCRSLVEQRTPVFGVQRKILAKRLGSDLLVSQTAMLYRLRHLGLGTE